MPDYMPEIPLWCWYMQGLYILLRYEFTKASKYSSIVLPVHSLSTEFPLWSATSPWVKNKSQVVPYCNPGLLCLPKGRVWATPGCQGQGGAWSDDSDLSIIPLNTQGGGSCCCCCQLLMGYTPSRWHQGPGRGLLSWHWVRAVHVHTTRCLILGGGPYDVRIHHMAVIYAWVRLLIQSPAKLHRHRQETDH